MNHENVYEDNHSQRQKRQEEESHEEKDWYVIWQKKVSLQ
jgi:hypothetical protein